MYLWVLKLSTSPYGEVSSRSRSALVNIQALLFTASIQLLISFNLLIFEAKQTMKASKANCSEAISTSRKRPAAVGLQHHVTHDMSLREDDGQDPSVNFINQQVMLSGKYGKKTWLHLHAGESKLQALASCRQCPHASHRIHLIFEGPECSNCASQHKSIPYCALLHCTT